jgi:transcriptional regulator with XRE-family HTH domain
MNFMETETTIATEIDLSKFAAYTFSPEKAKAVRLESGIGLREFARNAEKLHSKLKASSVSKYETGTFRPPPEVIPFYLQALNCRFEEIHDVIYPNNAETS